MDLTVFLVIPAVLCLIVGALFVTDLHQGPNLPRARKLFLAVAATVLYAVALVFGALTVLVLVYGGCQIPLY
jgi:hypothetical protein